VRLIDDGFQQLAPEHSPKVLMYEHCKFRIMTFLANHSMPANCRLSMTTRFWHVTLMPPANPRDGAMAQSEENTLRFEGFVYSCQRRQVGRLDDPNLVRADARRHTSLRGFCAILG
jgi:hypothetical protein